MLALAAALAAAAPAAAAAARDLAPIDLAEPARPQPGPGEAMVVLRLHAPAMAGDNRVLFAPFDRSAGAIREGREARGFRAHYSYSIFGGERGARVLRVLIVPAGDYVLAGRSFDGSHTDSFCLGAPVFTVAPGSVTYLGDYEMFALRLMPDRERRNAMRYSANLEEARAALAEHYPAQARALGLWSPANGHRFACQGTEFTAYAVPGAGGGEAPATY